MPQTSYEYKESMITRLEGEIEDIEDELKGATTPDEIKEIEQDLKEAEEDLERIENTPAETLLRERYS